ncbi:MAG TPA: bifunctional UDP-N-acetylglucosamine diphosphorylase/glucosamine-1-phosphate N-acetyltransferase GlmU, partial [Gammaproteobacteria bacterium]|nr:bifunctional UDP-N-acetylglucosamine diphosphorylase/glucosamine-1-phosphate N-acetyltransferase GlmU [Gammaproteobacteria bacterium]
MNDIGVIVLAAGQGTRMKSDIPKVLHHLGGTPLFLHVLRAAQQLEPSRIAVIVGHGATAVQQAYSAENLCWVIQDKQLGTAHAVLCAEATFHRFTGDILILSGDVPLIRESTLKRLLDQHHRQQAAVTLLTANLEDPKGYGRIVRDNKQQITFTVEEKDASDLQKQIHEVNAGIYVAAGPFLFSALSRVNDQNRQGEYYLPDIVAIAAREHRTVANLHLDDAREMMGINTREELARMEKSLQEEINRKWMAQGITLKDPATTYIEESATIGKDTVIGPNTHLCGTTVIGERCRIDGSAYLTDAHLADEVHLRFSVVLSSCRVAKGAIIGPFAHLRPGTELGRNVHIGNFVEAKEARIGDGSKANHLTYLGDVTIGCDSNIGAGTITCNYDGFQKYKTKIGDRVQVGSDSTLVAPISLGNDVYVATATT